ncbi:HAMP domain-containing histidine kinase [Paracoccus caeni]|uniref:histidine kinase n=1 Tax=Paracoccus caeni TaxID=657651 RepID=A0A934SDN8_9RHOB|nr:HAMP domain-containing sensor histidine kinase [Paracoccus caeni]MBK4216981.1 HAMP domain-containing histidine kinase [Paracoccus caeni]
MSRNSLRLRLILAGAVAIVLTLGLSTIGLSYLFVRHVERVAVDDLQSRAMALASMVEISAGSPPRLVDPPPDPLFRQPFSGHYWQVSLGDEMRRSRSLWDYQLPAPDDLAAPGQTRVLSLPGPQGEALLVVEQSLLVDHDGTRLPLRILVATDRDALDLAEQGFLRDLMPFLVILGALLLTAFWMQIRVGLRPLSQVSNRVRALTTGDRARIGTDLPDEVVPLSRQIDELLDARDAELLRARHRAADLAHGFKTPLQALLGDAEKLRDQGQDGLAGSIETVVGSMRRLVDRELTRARIQSDLTTAEAEPETVINRVVQVLRRMPRGADLGWHVSAGSHLRARIDPDDLTEALGALLENAMRHAESAVWIDVTGSGSSVQITIRDDGPGVPADDLQRMTKRGVRLDQSGEGQGIGLAIVHDIIDAADGQVALENAGPGLRVTITLHAR